jgi:osmotically-inducible protein OsmY
MANRYDDRNRYDEQGWRREGRDDRGFMDRASDEVKSWFGDEEAERRRRIDEQRSNYTGGRPGGEFGQGYPNRYSRENQWAGRTEEDERYGRDRDNREGSWRREGREQYAGSHHPEDFSRAYNETWRNRGYGQGWMGSEYIGRGDRSPSSEYGGYGRGAYGRERDYERRDWSAIRGRFAGRGPSGYQRSDERIREDINDRLTDDPYIDATHIRVAVKGGEVTLEGNVDDRESKRRAEDLVEAITGVKDVRNQIRVGQNETTQPHITT